MQLFYAPRLSTEDLYFDFSKEESKHLIRVLRHSIGDRIEITNGMGWLFEATIIADDPKRCQVEIQKSTKQEKHSYHLHLAVAPTKMNDRFEWFVEKATEIGIDEITPIICDRSERKVIKQPRLVKTALTAMKQSKGYYLPKIHEQKSFNDFIKESQADFHFIAHCIENDKKSLKESLEPNKRITLLVGPEGDFSVKEIEMALAQNYIPVTLGHKRLRTETAAIVACMTVALINE